MMLIFPEEMKRIDPDDPARSLRQIEDELAYIRERTDHAIRSLMERMDRVEEGTEGGD